MIKFIQNVKNVFRKKEREAFFSKNDENFQYRRLSKTFNLGVSDNEISDALRSKTYKVIYDLHLKNPLAKRILEVTRDFAVGDGLRYECDDKSIKDLIDKFWHNQLNNLDLEISRIAYDLGLWGEIILKMDVNPINGFATISYLDPTKVKDVIVNKENIKDIEAIIFTADGFDEIKYNVIKENNNGLLEGDVFYYRVNHLTNQVRGISDLLSLIDWLDALDTFLFRSIERVSLLNSFIYHIQWIGLSSEEIIENMKIFGNLKPGSIHHTNENVKISAITPDIKASDTTELVRVVKSFILGCAGFPEHWFGDGGNTNLATAKEMGLPTFQKLKERQSLILTIVRDLIRFQIDQAYRSGRIAFDINNRPLVTLRSIDVKENSLGEFTNSLTNMIDFITKATDKDLLDKEIGKKIIQSTLELSGYKKV